MAKPGFYSQCSFCFYEGFSHESQADADRATRNHQQRCEDNPDNQPYAWRDGPSTVQTGGKGCAPVGLLLLSVPTGVIYMVYQLLG